MNDATFTLARACIGQRQTHPEVVQFVTAALWSINERLGGGAGADLAPLGTRWVDDVLSHAQMESEAIEKARRKSEQEARRHQWQ